MKYQNLSDAEVISHYKAGNEEVFAVLVNRYKSKVFTKIFYIVKDKYIAEDLTQDVFIKAVNTIKSGKYNEEGKFAQWVSRVAHNLAIDFFRKNKRHPTITMEDGSNIFNTLKFAEDSFEVEKIKNETKVLVRDLIKKLPENQREVLIMRHYEDMSFQEIAEATGVSINTALGRMRYALINLRKHLSENNNAYDQNLYSK